MEREYFEAVRAHFCRLSADIRYGKMMSSEAITYQGKVFAFFSRKQKMVFKLGKDYRPDTRDENITVFNPFTNRPPLNGWFEVSYADKDHWIPLAEQALEVLQSDQR